VLSALDESARSQGVQEAYIKVLAKYMWSRLPQVETAFRSVELYAFAVGIPRPEHPALCRSAAHIQGIL
jgi:hypothetical protein